MKEGMTFLEAYKELRSGPPYNAKAKEKKARVGMFQEAFQLLGTTDIICLQESTEMQSQDLQNILPSGYSFFSYETTAGRDGTIVWNSEKFDKVAHANVTYDPTYIPLPEYCSAPDTIVLLRDRMNGTTICVGSAHLRGFSLAYNLLEKDEEQQELKKAQTGDNQTKYDLDTMDAISADLYVFAGDYNVTREHYQPRFDIIYNHAYITDIHDDNPTMYDINLKEQDGETPKPVKLDYIFVKGRKDVQVQVQHIDLQKTQLDNFNRPSDHLPIGAQVQFIYNRA